MRLLPGVYVVGSGNSGFGLTDPFDSHVYLLVDRGEAALVDSGIGASADAIVANAEAAGIDPGAIRHLLLTHAHPDHAGGAAALKARLPELHVVASPCVARWVGTADEDAMSIEMGKRAEFYPPDYRFTACPGVADVRGGDRIDLGALAIEVIETPGHADGHVSYLVERPGGTLLFSGDLVFFDGQISLENTWDCRIQEYAASMARLREAAVDVLLPGHHLVSLRDGQRHIDAANRLFDRGFVPKSVV